MHRTRRDFLKLACAGLGATTLLRPAFLQAAAQTADTRLLAALARGIFPHRRLPDSLYVKVAGQVEEQAAASPALGEVVATGLARTRALAGPESGSDPAARRRLAILRELDGGPFFNLLRNNAVQVLYRDPQVWDMIGYGGNAIAQGGYLDSFNDIDWLPE